MPAQRAREILRTNPLFAGLPRADTDAVADVAREDTYATRDHIFMEGDPADWFWIVIEGRVRIVRHSRSGRDVVLEVLGPGEVFGGVAVIERRPYPASAQAMEPSTVLKLPGDAVRALTERHPSLIREMALVIGRRLRGAHDAVESLAVDPVEARLARRLLRLGEEQGVRRANRLEIPFPLTRQNLADMAGTTVETTIRIVSRWLKGGLVREEEGHFVLCDVRRLGALAEGDE